MENPIDQMLSLVGELLVLHNMKRDFRNMSILFTSHTFWYRCWDVLLTDLPEMVDITRKYSALWGNCAWGFRWLHPRNLITEGFPKEPQECDAFVPIDNETGDTHALVIIVYNGEKWVKEGDDCTDWDTLMKED